MDVRLGHASESYIIIVAACVCSFVTFGTVRLAGLLFVACLTRYSTSRKEASLPFVLNYTTKNLTGPLVGFLGNKFGLRAVIVLGCFLSAIAVGACFFAEDIITITVLWGGAFGFAFGLGTTLIPNVLQLHFTENYNKMNGIYFGAAGMGSIVLPAIADFFLKTYGTSGTFLMISGIVLNCVPAAMLLWEPERKNKVTNTSSHTGKAVLYKSNNDYLHGENIKTMPDLNTKRTKNREMISDLSRKCNEQSDPENMSRYFAENNTREYNNIENSDLIKDNKLQIDSVIRAAVKTEGICRSSPEIEVITTKSIFPKLQTKKVVSDTNMASGSSYNTSLNQANNIHISESDRLERIRKKRECVDVKEEGKTSIDLSRELIQKINDFFRNFQVFLDPTYILILLLVGIAQLIMTTLSTVIVDACRDKGIIEDVYVLTSFAVFQTLGNFLFGYASDSGYMTLINIYATFFVSFGLLLITFVWVEEFYVVIITVSAFGLITGGLLVVALGIIVKYIEKDNITMAIASRFFLFALLSFGQSPVIGYFRETLGSYGGLFYLLGALCLLGALTSLLIPSAARFRDNRHKRTKKLHKAENTEV